MESVNKKNESARARTQRGRVVYQFAKRMSWMGRKHIGWKGKVAGRKKWLHWNLKGERTNGNKNYDNEENWKLEIESIPEELRPLDESDKLRPEGPPSTATI